MARGFPSRQPYFLTSTVSRVSFNANALWQRLYSHVDCCACHRVTLFQVYMQPGMGGRRAWGRRPQLESVMKRPPPASVSRFGSSPDCLLASPVSSTMAVESLRRTHNRSARKGRREAAHHNTMALSCVIIVSPLQRHRQPTYKNVRHI